MASRERLSGVSPLARASKRSKEADVAKILKDADGDGDGVLSLAELRAYLGTYLGYGDAEIVAFFKEHEDAACGGVDLAGLTKGFASLNPYLVSKLKGSHVVRKPGAVCAEGAVVQLEELEDCTVLVCDRTDQVFVDECKNCQVLFGPCNSSVFVRDCVGCTFWIATRQLRTRDCKDCNFFLYSYSEPVIETSSGLGFAPLCASYPGFTRQFAEAKFNSEKNFWSAIFDYSGRTDGANWQILPLSECQELSVELPSEGGSWDCPLPKVTQESLCAPVAKSDEDGGSSVANIPQTRPPLPAASTGPRRVAVSDAEGSTIAAVQGAAKKAKAPPKLRKPKWSTVKKVTPDSHGVNVFVKVVKVDNATEGMSEVVVGDATATVTLRVQGAQLAACEPGKIVRIQNAKARIVKGFLRLEVGKWGVVKPATEDHDDIEVHSSKDISAVEYELA